MSGMTRTTPRTSRRERRCDGCRLPIERGARYLEHVAAPDAPDLNNTTWWRLAECAECAERYGRGASLAAAPPGAVPYEEKP